MAGHLVRRLREQLRSWYGVALTPGLAIVKNDRRFLRYCSRDYPLSQRLFAMVAGELQAGFAR